MRLEQAIFTSTKGDRLDGYQLATASSGISSNVARELTLWGPAHDSLWDVRRDARSVNFHPLSNGEYCLSCTRLAGTEYSARGGGRIYTQMFVLPPDVLARFANDPFLILRALAAAGRLLLHDEPPAELSTVVLLGRSDRPDPALIAQVLDDVGTEVFDELVAAVASTDRVAVLTSGQVERLFQAVLHALPVAQRLTLSFTTGLKDSPRRPFKLVVLPSDPAIIRQSQRASGLRIIDLAAGAARLPAASVSG